MHKRISSIVPAAIALTLAAAGPAAAQAPSLDDFRLRQTQLDFQSGVDALAARLLKDDVEGVLGEANRPSIEYGPCNADAFPDIPAGDGTPTYETVGRPQGGIPPG